MACFLERLVLVLASLPSSPGPGGWMVRRLLPAASAILITLAYLRWTGEPEGYYGAIAGVVLMTTFAIAMIGALLWYFALGIDRVDARRSEMEHELRRASRYFELS